MTDSVAERPFTVAAYQAYLNEGRLMGSRNRATGAVFGGIFTVAPGFLGSTIFLAIAISRFWVPAMGWQGPGPQRPLRWPSQGKG